MRNNDYGRGFCCTENIELAREWACAKNKNGYVNSGNVSGLSQSELAELSGVPLRQIQLFEQRQRDINKTKAFDLYCLAKTLGCRSEELLEI